MISDKRLKEIRDELGEAILYGDPADFNIDEFREQQQIIHEFLDLRTRLKKAVEEMEAKMESLKKNHEPELVNGMDIVYSILDNHGLVEEDK